MQQPTPRSANLPIFARVSLNAVLLALLCLAGCVVGYFVLATLPDFMIGVDTMQAFIAGTMLMLMLIATMAARARGIIDLHQQLLLSAILPFSLLIVAERVFYRHSTIGAAFQGSFDPSAYAEMMIWVLCFAVLLLLTVRNPGYLGRLLSPSFRWMFLLAFVSVASVAYSPSKGYSLAWSFKLMLGVILLRFILDEIESMDDLRWFFQAALWSFTALVALIALQLAIDPEPFDGGRMTESLSPTGVASISATLFLLALTFYSVKPNRKYLVLSGLGFVMMVLSGGKGAMFAALMGGTTSFILRKNLRSGLVFLTVVLLVGGLLVAVTPVQKYMVSYASSEGAETGTGRTPLWEKVIPAIMDKPWVGHGYATSKFIAEDMPEIGWPAGHTHNGFLEVLYNNGIIGLIFLLGMLGCTIRNLVFVIRHGRGGEIWTWAIGVFAIFVFEILNGMLNASFGGRVGSSYLMLLSLAMASEALAGLLRRVMLKAAVRELEFARA